MTNMQNNEEIVRQQLKGTDFRGNIRYKEHSGTPHFNGRTRLLTKEISVGYNPKYEKTGKDPIPVLKDIPDHEMDHHSFIREILGRRIQFYGCPRTADLSRKLIFEQMYKVLKRKGYSRSDVAYLENCFTDTLLHADLSRAKSLDGIVGFFEDVAQTSEEGFGDFYEAHVKLNLFFFGNKHQRRRLQKHFKHSDKVKKALQGFLEKSGLHDIQQEINTYERRKEKITDSGKGSEIIERKNKVLKVRDRNRMRDFLMDEKNWPKLAEIYAKEFLALMSPGYARPVFNHNGSGTKGREDEDDSQQGNVLQEEADSEDYRRERARESYENNESLPEWMSDTEEQRIRSLYLLYQSFARRMNIIAESKTQTRELPIAHFGNRNFDPLKDNPKRLRLRPDLEGRLSWMKRKAQIETPIQIRQSTKGFPRVKIAWLDESPSMLEDPNGGSNIGKKSVIPYGDNSKLHYRNVAFVSYLEFLKANNLLVSNDFELYSFSKQTRTAKGIDECIAHAFNPVFGEDTKMSPEKLRKVFEGKDALILTFSDGEIGNWDNVEEVFVKGAENNHCAHIQIGKPSIASRAMEKMGIVVAYVMKYEDTAKITLDLIRRVRGATQ